MSTKFTPGPWEIEPNSGDIFTGNHLIAIMAGENYGQWRPSPDDGAAEFDANARLIATAPDLYVKLQGLVFALGVKNVGEKLKADVVASRVQDALDVLAKARGE